MFTIFLSFQLLSNLLLLWLPRKLPLVPPRSIRIRDSEEACRSPTLISMQWDACVFSTGPGYPAPKSISFHLSVVNFLKEHAATTSPVLSGVFRFSLKPIIRPVLRINQIPDHTIQSITMSPYSWCVRYRKKTPMHPSTPPTTHTHKTDLAGGVWAVL